MAARLCDECKEGEVVFLARRLKVKDDTIRRLCNSCGRKLEREGYVLVSHHEEAADD